MSVRVKLPPGIARWTYEDVTVDGVGEHDLDGDGVLLGAVAAAVAAGSLLLVEGDLPKDAVQSDKDSLKLQAKADKARAPLYRKRDEALFAGGDTQAILDQFDAEMAAAAQAALEE